MTSTAGEAEPHMFRRDVSRSPSGARSRDGDQRMTTRSRPFLRRDEVRCYLV